VGAKPKIVDVSKPKEKTAVAVSADTAKKKDKQIATGQENVKAKPKAAPLADADTAKSKKKSAATYSKPKTNAEPSTDQQ
jgi:hypothetical protein